ncbi:MAG: hypothetical protein JSV96_14310 [Candidatus Aminicenantes bacterium]|nr:MAG: hypothetical protein JSV96_14310 [Candidatus Aminicenantes bacterium]
MIKILERTRIRRIKIFSCIMFLSAFFMVSCTTISTFELDSNWRSREVVVDGNNNEWLGAMLYFEGEYISVGIRNDESFFYMCMIAEEPIIRAQVMRQGFTVWFDPDGGDEKTFGIKFPIGMQAIGTPEKMIPRRERESEPDPEEMQRAFRRLLAELEILGPGKDEQARLKVEEAKGIDIVLNISGEMLVYELKVPLLHNEQHPYAVGAEVGNLIGVGLEIPKLDMSAIRDRMGGRRPGGTGMPGGGRIGGMGMRGARGLWMPRGIKLWMAIQLAAGQSQ